MEKSEAKYALVDCRWWIIWGGKTSGRKFSGGKVSSGKVNGGKVSGEQSVVEKVSGGKTNDGKVVGEKDSVKVIGEKEGCVKASGGKWKISAVEKS